MTSKPPGYINPSWRHGTIYSDVIMQFLILFVKSNKTEDDGYTDIQLRDRERHCELIRQRERSNFAIFKQTRQFWKVDMCLKCFCELISTTMYTWKVILCHFLYKFLFTFCYNLHGMMKIDIVKQHYAKHTSIIWFFFSCKKRSQKVIQLLL